MIATFALSFIAPADPAGAACGARKLHPAAPQRDQGQPAPLTNPSCSSSRSTPWRSASRAGAWAGRW
ncbi:hypothetical protein OG876_00375 [Kribbella sp. NBC_00359]